MPSSYNTPEQLRSEIYAIRSLYENLLAQHRRALKLWLLRWGIGTVLYVVFWEYTWVRWTLLLSIPLAAVSLGIALAGLVVMPRRLKKLEEQLAELELEEA